MFNTRSSAPRPMSAFAYFFAKSVRCSRFHATTSASTAATSRMSAGMPTHM
jgi:hypothetical protein